MSRGKLRTCAWYPLNFSSRLVTSKFEADIDATSYNFNHIGRRVRLGLVGGTPDLLICRRLQSSIK